MNAVFRTDCPNLRLHRRGKVRDVYDVGDFYLIVATDRISAFDVIMNEPVPGKGALLTSLSMFWFERTKDIIANHVVSVNVDEYPAETHEYRDQLEGRSMLVRKAQPLPIECVVRGYLAGSGWNEYKDSRMVCGVPLPEGLIESSKLPAPIFTPATKAEEGHDENIRYDRAVEIVGAETAEFVRRVSIDLYAWASGYAASRGIILADTKFEFGRLADGSIILIDEALTPDSSRYWLAEEYAPGKAQVNFDKQVLRDWLLTQPWDKQPPAPTLPPEIIAKTLAKYEEAARRLMGA
ncbi:MAG: phosphoribosylaminoimidazolesuccinocarboxamide synthase [Candidatus Kapaibacterium sp.]